MNVSESQLSIFQSAQQILSRNRAQLKARSPQAEQTAEYAAQKLLEWCVPEEAAAAALLAPLLEAGLLQPEDLKETFWQPVLLLCQNLAGWKAHRVSPDSSEDELVLKNYAYLKLRSLYRQAYIDFPDLSALLLILAEHDARLQFECTPALAVETKRIYLPLSEMLGIWALRREWLERCIEIISRNDPVQKRRYQQIKNLLGESTLYSAEEMHRLHENPDANIKGKESSSQKRIHDKAEALVHIERDLNQLLDDLGIQLGLKIRPKKALTGRILWRTSDYDQQAEMINHLSIEIICPTQRDCYMLSGLVHNLGCPAPMTTADRFLDYIASPQPNGYRAIHTSIEYPISKGSILIEFRILTEEMRRLNEYGVIEAVYRSPQTYQNVSAWWNRRDKIRENAVRIFNLNEAASLKDILIPVGFKPEYGFLYAFSPKGEIFLLGSGSTPLDFAYNIHTELGHHAGRIRVNGQSVPLSLPLRSGDLVEVEYSSNVPGPDLSWLQFTHTSSAHRKILSELNRQAAAIHPGRLIIQSSLVKRLVFYQENLGVNLSITLAQLDSYLYRFARRRGFTDLRQLYQAVESKQLMVNRIVDMILSNEFSSAIMLASNKRIPYPTDRILICPVCHPIPGEKIIAIEHNNRNGFNHLTIHKKNGGCYQPKNTKNKIFSVRWKVTSQSEHPEVLWFHIHAIDRPSLLENILVKVQEEKDCKIHHVEAHAQPDGSAELALAISTSSLNQQAVVQRDLESVRSVLYVWSRPATAAQRLSLSQPAHASLPNPYTEHEVDDRQEFYDRVEIISDIKNWLNPGKATWMILHGQRRVGKSSLAKYLINEVLSRSQSVVAVYVTLQSLSSFETENITNLIANAVFKRIAAPVPTRQSCEEPVPWLKRCLFEASRILDKANLLICIDEFNVLMDMEMTGCLDVKIYNNLRAIMKDSPELRWMLIVQDTHYKDPERWGCAGQLFEEGLEVLVPHLDATWSDKLIREPTERLGLHFADAKIPSQIYELTNGNPFLIKAVCFILIENVRNQSRSRILPPDLKRAENAVIADGRRYFDHFLFKMSKVREAVLIAYVLETEKREWLAVSDLYQCLKMKIPNLDERTLQKEIHVLDHHGVFETQTSDGEKQIRIPIKLFYSWLKDDYRPKQIEIVWKKAAEQLADTIKNG